ncbi:MAG: 4-(cytidine 5'-diphospho)-2-C-methyl-D-erythritol kinase, partial [Spirochaetales bacterium]|nr:4-(cytidine 5'-diphospho)-2-C-methyl-D-erythritol kinase [Spirochaetales bacterium]
IFLEHNNVSSGVDIEICKRIPIGGGLGGGSSDAACVLISLNFLCGTGMSREELKPLAAQIGSDVPFFLHGPAALVGGRGEEVESFMPEKTWWVLLVDPGFSISTADAFKWLDEFNDHSSSQDSDFAGLNTELREDNQLGQYYNSFEPILRRRFPSIEIILNVLEKNGAALASVSGSGSLCFGLFNSYEKASRASDVIKGSRIWIKETLASSLYGVLQ